MDPGGPWEPLPAAGAQESPWITGYLLVICWLKTEASKVDTSALMEQEHASTNAEAMNPVVVQALGGGGQNMRWGENTKCADSTSLACPGAEDPRLKEAKGGQGTGSE